MGALNCTAQLARVNRPLHVAQEVSGMFWGGELSEGSWEESGNWKPLPVVRISNRHLQAYASKLFRGPLAELRPLG